MFDTLLLRIAKKLIEPTKQTNLGLLSGSMGEIIFLYEYSKSNKKFYKYAEQKLERLFSSIYNGNVFHSYCAGLAGIGIGLFYLKDRGFIDDSTVISEEIDTYLEAELRKCILGKNYDFLHGAIGIGFYFIKRHKTRSLYSKRILKLTLDYLYDTAVIDHQGLVKWARYKSNGLSYDLSMSHGSAGIILFLCKLLTVLDNKDCNRAINLINGAVNFILLQEIDFKKNNSYFPYSIEPSVKENRGSRLAWCYGDLGISIALLEAASSLKRKEWKEKAIEIIDYSQTRKELLKNWVMDSCICHGTSGIALIFYELYKRTGNLAYYNSTEYWITKTLEFCDASDVNSFKLFYIVDNNKWAPNSSILEGLSGVGLTILSFYKKEIPYWDEFLFLR